MGSAIQAPCKDGESVFKVKHESRHKSRYFVGIIGPKNQQNRPHTHKTAHYSRHQSDNKNQIKSHIYLS